MRIEYAGPERGLDARMSWSSSIHGSGSQIIEKTEAPRLIQYRIDMGGGRKATSRVELTAQGPEETLVVWTLKAELGDLPNNRYMGLIYPSWIKADHTLGLNRLKSLVETGKVDGAAAVQVAETAKSEPATPSEKAPPQSAPGKTPEGKDGDLDVSGLPEPVQKALTDKESQPTPLPSAEDLARDPDVAQRQAQAIIYVSTTAKSGDQAATNAALADANNELIAYIQKHGLDVSGAPLAIWDNDEEGDQRRFDAAIPLLSVPPGLPEEGRVKVGELEAGLVIMGVHRGAYSSIGDTLTKLRGKLRDKGMKPGKRYWEEYVSDPGETNDDELLTNVYVQVQ